MQRHTSIRTAITATITAAITAPFRSALAPLATVLAVAGLQGCSDGQLGQAAIDTQCPAGDVGCDGTNINQPLAQNAVLPLELRPKLAGAFSVPLRLHPVDTDVVTLNGEGALVGVGSGVSAVLLVTEDGSVVDLMHITVAKADRLSLHRGSGAAVDERSLPERIEVFPGEELNLVFRAFHGPQRLIGDLDETWAVDNADFSLVDRGFAEERTVRAPDVGETTLVISLGTGIQRVLRLTVVP